MQGLGQRRGPLCQPTLAGASPLPRAGWMWPLQASLHPCAGSANSQVGANMPYSTFMTTLGFHRRLVPTDSGL